ncbi:MAG: GNAT family N-acetyltransferase [Anaerolineales bacterium]|jgi:GNAT superfamily N-acetyltransferase|nr:GNAT family N-acetyltransferase [Anaerolineales bacterium]
MIIFRVDTITDEIYQAFQDLIPQLTSSVLAPTRAELEALAAFEGSILLAARLTPQGKIVGVATLSLVRAPTGVHARLEDVVVAQEARGQGVGAALTEEAIRLARALGANYLALTSNPRRAAANQLYQKLGFKRWETNVYRFDL